MSLSFLCLGFVRILELLQVARREKGELVPVHVTHSSGVVAAKLCPCGGGSTEALGVQTSLIGAFDGIG